MSRKDRHRARRRVERTMEEAWQAVEAGELARAFGLAERARAAGGVNPRILLDHGRIALLCDKTDEAEDSFRAAIALAPGYAEAFAALAELQFRRGKFAPAVRLQSRAAELAPADPLVARTLASYREEARAAGLGDLGERAAAEAAAADEPPRCTERTDRYDWSMIRRALTERGQVELPGLLSTGECAALRELYGDAACEAEIELDDDLEGHYAFRHLLPPLPPLVRELREELYSRAATLCNGWREDLGKEARLPAVLAAFTATQEGHRSSPGILRLPPADGMLPRREERRHAFPLQLVADRGPEGAGRLALTDRRPGRKVRRRELEIRAGDGAFHCVRDRMDRIAGVYGLQPVAWSCTNPGDSERYVLVLPFQDD